jgi:hypothetical protein
MKKMILGLMATATIVFSACKEDDPIVNNGPGPRDYSVSVNGKIVTVNNLDADTILGFSAIGQPYGAGKYTFFSLVNNSRVNSADSATANWDIAFKGNRIIVNSGTSGPGNGGGFVYINGFDAVPLVPADSTFRTDNVAINSYAITWGSGNGWYNYDGPTNLLTPIPGRTLIIRTANGKYAKLEILNYYRGGITPLSSASDDVKAYDSRFYTFRYTYQPDGTTNF